MKKKALIAMSGGVDSSVAAALMIQKGYECTGCTMRLFDYTGIHLPEQNTCCGLDDVQDARSVAETLGMEFKVLNFMDEFRCKVMDRFVDEYLRGRTPNPCIDCNRYMKFGRLWEWAKENGYDVIVTGHYAHVSYDEDSGRWCLERAKNTAKDQSYVLYAMTQEQLAHTRFPLGEAQDKNQIRAMAKQYGFVNSSKPDSQDICFVPDGVYADFIERQTGETPAHGNFVDEQGNILGEHKGLVRYTIGQRKGLGLALPQPMFVKRKDMERNEVVLTVSEGLFTHRLVAEDFNWIWTPDWRQNAGDGADAPRAGTVLEVTAKPRYRAKEAPASVRVLEGGNVEILFHDPQRALTTGQAVVLYSGDKVVGGGTIAEVTE